MTASTDRRLTCLVSGCSLRRWANSAVCSAHWRRLTTDERRELSELLRAIGAAVLADDERTEDEMRDDAESFFGRIGREIDRREETPLKPRTP